MLNRASLLSEKFASSRKSKDVITNNPHGGKLVYVALAWISGDI